MVSAVSVALHTLYKLSSMKSRTSILTRFGDSRLEESSFAVTLG